LSRRSIGQAYQHSPFKRLDLPSLLSTYVHFLLNILENNTKIPVSHDTIFKKRLMRQKGLMDPLSLTKRRYQMFTVQSTSEVIAPPISNIKPYVTTFDSDCTQKTSPFPKEGSRKWGVFRLLNTQLIIDIAYHFVML